MISPTLDPLTLTAPISLANLKEILESLQPDGLYGMVYKGPNSPGLTGTAFKCLWLNSTDGQIYRWNGTNWVPVTYEVVFEDGSIDVIKLSLTGSTANAEVVCRFDGEITFKAITDLIAAGTFPINRLAPPTTTDKYVLYWDGTTLSWSDWDDLVAAIVASVPLELTARSVTANQRKWNSELHGAGTWDAGNARYTVVVGTGDTWTPGVLTDGIVHLTLSFNVAGTGNMVVVINGSSPITVKQHDGTALLASSIIPGVQYILVFDGTYLRLTMPIYTIPVIKSSPGYQNETPVGTPVTFTWAHGYGAIPHFKVICKVTENMTDGQDWAADDFFPADYFFATDLDRPYHWWADTTNVYLRLNVMSASDIKLPNKADGVDASLHANNVPRITFYIQAIR